MSIRDALAAIVGDLHVLPGSAEQVAYLNDWRGVLHGSAEAIVRPRTTEEVVDIVKFCAASGIAIVPQGGHTGLSGGATPVGAEQMIVLQPGRMNTILDVDTANQTATVEAGCILTTLQEHVGLEGMQFPLWISSGGSAQIGGMIGTNAGGQHVLRYGMMRDLVHGLEVVLADGSVWNGLESLRKNNVGYDMRHLFTGAEGTLGIVTKAVLKLFPRPRARTVAYVAFPDVDASSAFFLHTRSFTGDSVEAFELMPANGMALTVEHIAGARAPCPDIEHDFGAIIEIVGAEENQLQSLMEAMLEEAMAQDLIIDAVISQSTTQDQQLWALREGLVEAQRLAGGSIRHDISVPVASIGAFVKDTTSALLKEYPDAFVMPFGHLGDGNLHFNILNTSVEGTPERLSDIVYDHVQLYHGSISAEHGLGITKRDLAAARLDPTRLVLMKQIKQALDPQNMFNPGKVLSW